MNALEIRNLTKSYPGFELDHVNLTLPAGCILGLIGENGAGKTTTIKLILNMICREEGTITILGKDNQKDLCHLKEDIGVVLDEVGIPECLTAKQVGKVMSLSYRQWDQARYEELCRRMALPEMKTFGDYSRGMRMKLGIAVAMSHDAKLLLLDEPTSGLDPVVRDEVVEMFSDFTRDEEHSILISSHIVSDLEKLCDYIAFLHKGKVMLCEEKDLLLSKYGLVHCTSGELAEIPEEAVKHVSENPYGVEAMVLREAVPAGMAISPISIEELFLFMIKGKGGAAG